MAGLFHCNGEPGIFSEDEFLHQDGSIIRPYVHAHNVLIPHYASTGKPVIPKPTPGLATAFANRMRSISAILEAQTSDAG